MVVAPVIEPTSKLLFVAHHVVKRKKASIGQFLFFKLKRKCEQYGENLLQSIKLDAL